MNKLLVYISFLILFLQSCKNKELPEPQVNDEVIFYAEGTLNNEEFSLLAGPNNIIVTAEAELEEGELPVFTSVFSDQDCELCNESLIITITGESLFSSEFSSESYIPIGSYLVSSYSEPSEIEGVYSFSVPGLNIDEFFISSNEGFDTVNSLGLHALEEGSYNYQFSFSGLEDECSGSIFGSFNILSDGSICNTQLELFEDENGLYFSTEEFSEDIIFLSINGLDIVPLFLIGEPVYLADFMEEGAENISIGVIGTGEDSDCSGVDSFYELTGDLGLSCFPTLAIEPGITPVSDVPLSVTVEYVSESGNHFISGNSNDLDNFSLLEIEAYGEDPYGRQAFRALVSFSITLESADGLSDNLVIEVPEAYIPIVFE